MKLIWLPLLHQGCLLLLLITALGSTDKVRGESVPRAERPSRSCLSMAALRHCWALKACLLPKSDRPLTSHVAQLRSRVFTKWLAREGSVLLNGLMLLSCEWVPYLRIISWHGSQTSGHDVTIGHCPLKLSEAIITCLGSLQGFI